MGVLDRIFGGTAYSATAMGMLDPVGQISGIVTPWGSSDATLEPFVYEDIFGATGIVTRAQAMTVPAVAAARSIILGEIAPKPLRALRDEQLVPVQPAWLQSTKSAQGPIARMMHTLDDWIFYGNALWRTERGADSFVQYSYYVPRSAWRINPDGDDVQVRSAAHPSGWVAADDSEYLYLPAPFEGLLAVASDTIRGALDIENSWRTRARTPLPGMILQETEDNGMTPDEMQKWVSAIAAQRRKPDGAVMGIPHKVTAIIAEPGGTDLLTEGRNAVKLDVANFLNLNPAMLGAALPKASLNYETQDGTRSEFVERMAFWTAPLEERLSLDDIVPHGQRVRFDFNLTADPAASSTGPTVED